MTEMQSAEVIEGKEPLVRFSLCFKKKQEMSDEELKESWEKFGRGPLSSIMKEKSIKYNQFHLSAEWKEQFSLIPPEDWLDFDGACDLLAKDVESILALFHDPTYINDINPEHDKFVALRSSKAMIGYNRVKYEKSTGGTVGEGKKPLVRLALCFKKKPDVTIEWADKYWDEQHAQVFTSVPIVQEKLIKYNQFHFSALGKEQFKDRNAEQWTDSLGVAEFWAKDVQSIMDIFSHEDYMNIILPDEEKFVERGSQRALIGYELDLAQLDEA